MASTPLRILQVLRAPTGGLWRHVADLSCELARRGNQVGLVIDSGFSDAQTRARLTELEPHMALGIHRIPIARQPGPGDFAAAASVRRLARKLGVSVVHGHGAKGGLYARIARLGRRGVVSAYTTHGGVLNYESASLAGRSFRHVERALLPFTDVVIFESGFARQSFLDQIGAPPHLSPIVHNGLAETEFAAVEEAPNSCDFVFVGELRPVKGLPYLISALEHVKARDGRPATLIAAGGGPDRDQIERQIAELGLGDRVTLAGVQPAREMFARGRCMVVPSLAESLPYVVLEAAAAERPMIASAVGGMAEIYGPTAEYLIPPADIEALRQALQRFMDAPQTAAAEMRTRLAFIRERFSLKRMTDGIEGAYRAALEKRR